MCAVVLVEILVEKPFCQAFLCHFVWLMTELHLENVHDRPLKLLDQNAPQVGTLLKKS